ncbi:arginine N-methyltransferase 3 [Ephemerocybe angulata]|uniref:type I protein arginine methyltransferase n=1 Tax=Ephemerocybe angulata TaxID=980116 RepID=A0A8H6M7I4_9AGAR|nr:arginine N-methyltransferase 3 [Tulosesus angulatus]
MSSIRLPPPQTIPDPEEERESSSSGSESSDDDDQNWDDWVSDSNEQQECRSLFDEKVLGSVEAAISHDSSTHGFDVNQVSSKLGLDFHGRVRLINYIRKNKLTPAQARELKGSEPWFKSDEYLVPVIESDPLIQVSLDDWSDSEDDEEAASSDPVEKARLLEKNLAIAQAKVAEYQKLLYQRLDVGGSDEIKPKIRDDDTHYFDSYAENDIHAVMINDKVRTASYAQFILTNPSLFRDAVVLDVGCGTGILSLFAARSGAKRVIAVDASDIGEKAKKIVKANGFEDVITVVRGKVEDITLPDGITQVDIIISEWMGYALLYESMLDSVLIARDRFLKPGGVMAPSQTKMLLGLCDASEISKDRIDFWNDVYGFDMSTMSEGLYDEAIIDVLGPETVLSNAYTVKDLILKDITTRQLNFATPFTLISTAERRTKINSFVLYFDTFFTVSGNPVPPETEVRNVKEGEAILAEVWPVGGKAAPQRRQSQSGKKDKITSFSTGPQSSPTHWKQTLFMLKEPFYVTEGTTVSGVFHCRKREDNSRELDVELHYSVHGADGPGETVVQMYAVR